MAQAKRDNSGVTVIMGVLNTDGVTPTPVKVSTSHILDVSNGSTGSDFGLDAADRDENSVTTMAATDALGNIIPLYVNSSGQLLIDTN